MSLNHSQHIGGNLFLQWIDRLIFKEKEERKKIAFIFDFDLTLTVRFDSLMAALQKMGLPLEEIRDMDRAMHAEGFSVKDGYHTDLSWFNILERIQEEHVNGGISTQDLFKLALGKYHPPAMSDLPYDSEFPEWEEPASRPITKKYFGKLAEQTQAILDTNLKDFFPFIQNYLNQRGYDAEFHIVSAGPKDLIEPMLKASNLHKYFKTIIASELAYDKNGHFCGVKKLVSDKARPETGIKTYPKSEAILDIYKKSKPWKSIFSGDGITDMDGMAAHNKLGGENIGIIQQGDGVFPDLSKDISREERGIIASLGNMKIQNARAIVEMVKRGLVKRVAFCRYDVRPESQSRLVESILHILHDFMAEDNPKKVGPRPFRQVSLESQNPVKYRPMIKY